MFKPKQGRFKALGLPGITVFYKIHKNFIIAVYVDSLSPEINMRDSESESKTSLSYIQEISNFKGISESYFSMFNGGRKQRILQEIINPERENVKEFEESGEIVELIENEPQILDFKLLINYIHGYFSYMVIKVINNGL